MKLNYKNIITFVFTIFMGMWCTHIVATEIADKAWMSPDPIIGGELFVCQQETVIYSVGNLATLIPGTTFQWTIINGDILQNNGDNITVMWSSVNPGNITLTATAPDGCATTNEQTVTIEEPENFSLLATLSNSFICEGDAAVYTATPSYEDIAVDLSDISYQWFINGVPVGTNSPMYTHTTVVDGDIATCEATSIFNCLINTTVTAIAPTITLIPRPMVDILIVANPNPVCPGDNVVFSTVTMNEGLQPDYEWQVNGVTVSSFPFYSQVGLMAGDTVTCSVLSENSCALNNPASDTVIIQELMPFPATITIAADTNPACAGELVTFMSTLVNEGDAPTFQWFVNGMPVLNQTSDVFGLYTFADGDVISCEMVSSSACASNAVAVSNDVILQLGGSFVTNVTLDAPNPFCIGSGDVEFTAMVDNPAPNPMFTWEVNGTTSVTTSNNQIMLPVNDGDLVTVTYTADFGDCYTAGDTMDMIALDGVNIVTPSVILVVDEDEICAGDSITFTPLPENGGASPDYQWFVNGTPFGENMDSYTTDTINDGDIISVELTTSLDCADTPTAISNGILVRASDIIAQIESVLPGCNDAGTIEVSASGGISNTYTYAWSDGQSDTIAIDLDTGTYTVTVTDEAGCSNTASADIISVDAPEILDGTTTIAACGFEDGTVSIELTGGTEPYAFEWTDEAGILVSTDSLQITVGTGIYTVLVTDASGCYDSATYLVEEQAPITVVAPEDVTIDLGDSIRIISYAETLDSVSFSWSPEMGVSCLDCAITYLSPHETTTYTVTITQAGGCTSTDQITVNVSENNRIFIPNIFSPNNDGVNDIFVINTGPGVAQIKSMRVYDRWGALVHNVENVPANREAYGWDGTFRGNPHAQNVYVYFVELELLNGKVIDFRGDVSLVR